MAWTILAPQLPWQEAQVQAEQMQGVVLPALRRLSDEISMAAAQGSEESYAAALQLMQVQPRSLYRAKPSVWPFAGTGSSHDHQVNLHSSPVSACRVQSCLRPQVGVLRHNHEFSMHVACAGVPGSVRGRRAIVQHSTAGGPACSSSPCPSSYHGGQPFVCMSDQSCTSGSCEGFIAFTSTCLFLHSPEAAAALVC